MRIGTSMVFLLMTFALAARVEAQWWGFIHCWGSSPLNGAGQQPQMESDYSGTYTQCHGVPGDDGDECSFTMSTATAKVSCFSTKSQHYCGGSIQCYPDVEPISCLGAGFEVFAGVKNGRGYLLCKEGAEVKTELECGLLTSG